MLTSHALAHRARNLQPPPPKQFAESLSGLIERVTFLNEENGFAVLKVKAEGRHNVGPALTDLPALIRHLESNPIAAWIGGRGTGDQSFFSYQDQQFSSRLPIAPELREALQELTRELAEWRLAEYLSRPDLLPSPPSRLRVKFCIRAASPSYSCRIAPNIPSSPPGPMASRE